MKYAMEGWYRDGEIVHSECASALDAYVALFGLCQSGRLTRVIATGDDGQKLFDAYFPAGDGMEALYGITPKAIAEITAAAEKVAEKDLLRRGKVVLAGIEAGLMVPPALGKP
jgi:hypothetical protein